MLALYRRLLPFVNWLLLKLAGVSPGVAQLVRPREGLVDRWRRADLGANRLWFHISSVGELEQVRPVLESLGNQGFSLVLSYFSASVPRLVKDWSFVKHADYLPLDFPEQMDELMEVVSPRLLVLNRYDLWPHHMAAAHRKGVPVVVVNASTPPLGWFGSISLWARKDLFLAVDAWTFVDAAAAAGWEPYVFDRVKGLVAGDPRVDRALGRVERTLKEGRARERLAYWAKKPFCLVAGSTWPEDEALLLAAWGRLDFPRSLLIVPHEPEEGHLRRLERLLKQRGLSFERFSRLRAPSVVDVVIVDERGSLAELYGTGHLAYVGGGFRKHIHSIIEPVAHGLPVAFGPNFRRSPEAVALSAAGSALALPRHFAVGPLAQWIRTMSRSGEDRARAEEPLRVFLQIHRGAGERVAQFLRESLERRGPVPKL